MIKFLKENSSLKVIFEDADQISYYLRDRDIINQNEIYCTIEFKKHKYKLLIGFNFNNLKIINISRLKDIYEIHDLVDIKNVYIQISDLKRDGYDFKPLYCISTAELPDAIDPKDLIDQFNKNQ